MTQRSPLVRLCPEGCPVHGLSEKRILRAGNRLKHLRSFSDERKIKVMTDKLPLVVCAILVAFGVLIIALSTGFFMNLLGAGIMALGGSAAYLIVSHLTTDTDSA